MKLLRPLFVTLLAFAAGCSSTPQSGLTLSGLDPARFDTLVDGKPIALYTLTNSRGTELCITNYGARIVSLMVEDREGEMRDVVLGFDNIEDYLTYTIPFGATIGRNSNRIRHARYTYNEVEYIVEPNGADGHSTHGGPAGWDGQIFKVESSSPHSIVMSYLSPDGESGFPGEVNATVTYTLTEDNSVDIRYSATSSAPTPINLTNHSYFTLLGDPSRSAMNSTLYMDADSFAPKGGDNVPSGEVLSVEGTPLDFRKTPNLEEILEQYSDYEHIASSSGFGVSMILNNRGGDDQVDIILADLESGITMEVLTSQPCVQLFSCNSYDMEFIGKGGIKYPTRNAICLETQHIPNAMNVEQWDSSIITPGEKYSHFCIYIFSTK